MTISFDPSLNARLRNEVRNYNKRLTRLEKAGVKNLPFHQKVSELKVLYNTREDLIKELNRLNKISRKDIEKRVNIGNEIKARKWEIDYIKSNKNSAKDYFEKEYERVNEKVGKFPGEQTYLNTIKTKIDILNKDITSLTHSEFRSTITAINEFKKSPSLRKERYREFLSEVEWVAEKLDYDKEEINKFFRKFEKLTPTQFLYAYDNNNIITKIYNLYHKDYGETEGHLTTEEDDAAWSLGQLLEQADSIIKDAQLNSV